MPTILASEVIGDFRRLVQDLAAPYRYDDATAIRFLNRAIRLLAYIKPDVSMTRTTVQLQPGYLQLLPTPDTAVFKALRNAGSDGNQLGDPITVVKPSLLDALIPQWRQATANSTVRHIAFDDADKARYYVYPPQPNPAHYIEVLYDVLPTTLTTTGDTLSVEDRYAVFLPEAMAYYAYSEDSANENNAALADRFYNSFMSYMGVSTAYDAARKLK